MKKILMMTLLFLIIFACDFDKTFAEEIFYKNSYGVVFNKEEYDFISNYYFAGYQDYMTQDDYDEFINSKIMYGKIQTITSKDDVYIPSFILDYNDRDKLLRLSSSCSGETCFIASTLFWNNNPLVKSYDLFGLLTENTNIISKKQSYLYYDNNIAMPTKTYQSSNSYTAIYKLPNSNNINYIIEEYIVGNSGKVTASYQHAKNNVTLEQSSKYIYGPTGCGGVFVFYYDIKDSYDCMLGLYLLLG